MISHLAIPMNPVPKLRNPLCNQRLQALAVVITKEDGLAPVATGHDVVEPIGKMHAWFSCHARRVPSENKKASPTHLHCRDG